MTANGIASIKLNRIWLLERFKCMFLSDSELLESKIKQKICLIMRIKYFKRKIGTYRLYAPNVDIRPQKRLYAPKVDIRPQSRYTPPKPFLMDILNSIKHIYFLILLP